MAKPYSLDLRVRILKDYDSGVPVEYLVVHYEVSRSWLYSLIKQRRESGSIAPRPYLFGNRELFQTVEKSKATFPRMLVRQISWRLSDTKLLSPVAIVAIITKMIEKLFYSFPLCTKFWDWCCRKRRCGVSRTIQRSHTRTFSNLFDLP